jgi:hypothetical protein
VNILTHKTFKEYGTYCSLFIDAFFEMHVYYYWQCNPPDLCPDLLGNLGELLGSSWKKGKKTKSFLVDLRI